MEAPICRAITRKRMVSNPHMDAAMGRVKERDRMASIVAPTQHAWRQAA